MTEEQVYQVTWTLLLGVVCLWLIVRWLRYIHLELYLMRKLLAEEHIQAAVPVARPAQHKEASHEESSREAR